MSTENSLNDRLKFEALWEGRISSIAACVKAKLPYEMTAEEEHLLRKDIHTWLLISDAANAVDDRATDNPGLTD